MSLDAILLIEVSVLVGRMMSVKRPREYASRYIL